MPKPFANTTGFNGTFYDTYLIAMQAGTTTGDPGLNEMRKVTLGQLRAYVRQGFGNMMNFRGAYDSALPSDPQINDYFYASDDFDTYEQYHFYEYNGSDWFDISGVLSQYCTLAQAVEIAQNIIDALNDGSLVPLKAKQDQNGNVIDTTYATKVAVSPLLALGLSVVNGRVCQTYNL